MHICHLITSCKIGGAEQALYNHLSYAYGYNSFDVEPTMAFLDRYANRHTVICFYDGPFVQKFRMMGVKVVVVEGLLFKYDPIFFYRLFRAILKVRPTIIHSALWFANLLGRVIGAVLGIPVVADLHNQLDHNGRVKQTIDRYTSNLATRFIGVSREISQTAQDELNTTRCGVIYNGVDQAHLQKIANQKGYNRLQFGLSEDAFVIGAVGRLEAVKSFDVLFRAVSYVLEQTDKKIEVCLIGDGSQRTFLEQYAKKVGISDRVRFLGYQNDSFAFYPLFDCFVITSQSEGLSMALLEALAFGLPIITTHHSDNHEVIMHGEHGFLAPINGSRVVAKYLLRLLNDINLRKEIKHKNLALVNDNFALSRTVAQYDYLYRELIRRD